MPQDWDLAISPRGDVGVAWSTVGAVAAAFRPRGGAFEKARLVDSGTGQQPAIAFDGDGNAFVAYAAMLSQHHHRIVVRRRPAGAGYGPEQVVDDAPHLYAPDIAANAAGSALLTWSRQDRTGRDSKENGILGAVFDLSFPTVGVPSVNRATSTPGLEFKVSAAGAVVARFERRDAKAWTRIGKAKTTAKRGRNVVRPGGKLAKRLRKPGTYRATLSATLDGGLETTPQRVKFKVRAR
jgi:hypothetical protein